MKKTIGLAVLILACASCFAPHAKRYFELGNPAAGPEGPAFDRTLYLSRPEINSFYDDFRIVYRLSPTEVNYYAYDFWAEKPSRMIRNVIRERVGLPGRFRRVDMEPGREATDWTLRVKVYRIEEIDRLDRWSGRLALAFEVADTATGENLASRSFDREEPLPQKDPVLLAGVLSKILAEELDAFLRELAAKSGFKS